MKKYRYKIQYEWRYGRRVRIFEHPKEFIRELEGDTTAYAVTTLRTLSGNHQIWIPKSEMTLITEESSNA